MDWSLLSDSELEQFRTEPKMRVSSTRPKQKGLHFEQQFECVPTVDSPRRYRVFKRWNQTHAGIFSVGLTVLLPGANALVLCRYNSGHHGHRNILEKEKLSAQPHIHIATARYIAARMDPDGFAVPTDRYASVDGALKCLVMDCCISGILDLDTPETLPLFPP